MHVYEILPGLPAGTAETTGCGQAGRVASGQTNGQIQAQARHHTTYPRVFVLGRCGHPAQISGGGHRGNAWMRPRIPDAAVQRICRALIKFHERGGRGLSLSNGVFLGMEISRLLDICRSR